MSRWARAAGFIILQSHDGRYGVYDLMPNAMDHFGIWENNPQRVDPDYYITEDGKSGIIVRHLQAGAPYCVWYAHWQGLNPAKGVGWPAFTTVVDRIQEHLRERVVWLRPSDITSRYHAAGGWGFLEQVSLDVATRRLVDQHWTPVICVGIPRRSVGLPLNGTVMALVQISRVPAMST